MRTYLSDGSEHQKCIRKKNNNRDKSSEKQFTNCKSIVEMHYLEDVFSVTKVQSFMCTIFNNLFKFQGRYTIFFALRKYRED